MAGSATFDAAYRHNQMANRTHVTVEAINRSYVDQLLQMTLPALAGVEAILGGRQSGATTLAVVMKPFAVGWEEQLLGVGP